MVAAIPFTSLPSAMLFFSATTGAAQALPAPSADLIAKLESIYKDLHANPELSMQEQRTAGIAADWLRQHGYEVTEKIGGTGVVGLLRNGEGERCCCVPTWTRCR